MLVQSLTERLRLLVGIKGWDYIVLWKLSDGHRSIEWIECCCAGSENAGLSEEELISFPSSSSTSSRHPCRDIMFPHPRIASCDLLDQLPSSVVLLESGVHAQTLLSNQISWLNYSQNSDSCLSKETVGTRVLIPLSLSLGLLELFVAKQVPEDQQVVDFIRAQCNNFMEQQTLSNSCTTDSFSSEPNAQQKDHSLAFYQQQMFADPSKPNPDLPPDVSVDRIHLCTSPLNPLQQFSNAMETENANCDIFFEGAPYEANIFTPSVENGLQEVETTRGIMMGNSSRWMEPSGTMEEHMNDDSFTCENNRSDDSDPNDDEDDAKYRRRTGKGPQSKNLVAERKRRKKLNDRLYSLRALVPKISKLDRASILGDAIDYVKELQKQVRDLQIELEEEHSDNEETGKNSQDEAKNCVPPSVVNQNGAKRGPKREHGNLKNGFHKGSSKNSKQKPELESTNDKVQQMEPQVEVFQLDGNEFFVKVFCEHKSGGFVRLMEALNSLGLEVTNVNATRHTCLVSSIFKVERKNDDMVQADHVKESLLELTRNPSRMWLNSEDESENGSKRDNNYHAQQDHHDHDRDHDHHSLICGRQMNSHHLQRIQH